MNDESPREAKREREKNLLEKLYLFRFPRIL